VKAIFGNKLAPSLADHYLAGNGYDAQQYDGHKDPNRPDNLYDPVPGDHGAHGSFDERAKTQSWEAWAEAHLPWLPAAVGLGIAAGMGSLVWKYLRRSSSGERLLEFPARVKEAAGKVA
jgi:hypothetical protein